MSVWAGAGCDLMELFVVWGGMFTVNGAAFSMVGVIV